MNVGNNKVKTGFHLACRYGNLDVVEFLVLQQEFDMNRDDNFGKTGFHDACIHGKLNVVQFLVQQGFDMNVGDYGGNTGFHLACLNGKLNVVQFLLQQGFDMYVDDHGGNTGFHWACYNGKLNVAQFLLQQGFDMNVGDNNGSTGFHWACCTGKFNVLQFLLRQGFGIFGFGLKLLIHARHHTNNELYIPCILLLMEFGAELDENDVFEELISAVQNRIIEITFMKEAIFEKWTGRIAQAITDFTMETFTTTSLQNLSRFLDRNFLKLLNFEKL